jgi:large subunit ribosomal protein L25
MDIPVLKVESRSERGKGAARRLRLRGLIPAVCYGEKKTSWSMAVNPLELVSILHGPRGMNVLIKLHGEEERTVFVQDFQRHPVERTLLHVDFLAIDENKSIRRPVPIEYAGKSQGVKDGGVLQVVERELLVEALPAKLPEKVSIDITPLLVGQSLHVQDIKLPEGTKAIFDRNVTICTVVAPSEEKVEVPAEVVPEGVEGEAVAPVEGAEGAEAPAEGAEKAPAGAKPAAGKPVAGKPAGAKPAGAKPVAAKPGSAGKKDEKPTKS